MKNIVTNNKTSGNVIFQLEQQDLNAVRAAIAAFGKEHALRPFGVLREIGVQAALKRLIDIEIVDSEVEATIENALKEKVLCPKSGIPLYVNTDRVRLESKILVPGEKGSVPKEEEKGRPKGEHDRTDLLLYRREAVRLVRYNNGAGDIVYRSFAESVLAAIEIKSDPSHTTAQKLGYANDIKRLLKLKSAGIHGFFVLLDKSSPFYGEFYRRAPLNYIRWNVAAVQPTPLRDLIYPKTAKMVAASDWDDVLISSKKPGDSFIEIYILSADPYELYYAYKKS